MRQSLSRYVRSFFSVFVLVSMVSAVGCSRHTDPGEEAPLETEDLPEAVVIDPELDPRAAPRQATLGGALPGGFPTDAYVLLPASVIDFGDGADGLSFVTFATSTSSAQVRRDLANRLRDRGWQKVPAQFGAAPHAVEKSGRVLRVHVERASTGATYRYDYRPQ